MLRKAGEPPGDIGWVERSGEQIALMGVHAHRQQGRHLPLCFDAFRHQVEVHGLWAHQFLIAAEKAFGQFDMQTAGGQAGAAPDDAFSATDWPSDWAKRYRHERSSARARSNIRIRGAERSCLP